MAALRRVADLLLPGIAKEAYRWFRAPNTYRDQAEVRRLSRAPRYVPMTMRLDGREIAVIDGPSAASMVAHIFGPPQTLRFRADRPNPLIYDCGANVGISVLYWKSLYPQSRVVAFEPDPQAFSCLRRNTKPFPDVELHQAAVWNMNGSVVFACDGADGGTLAVYNSENKSRISATVKAVRLRDLLTEPIDLLKMDIEGAEVDVLLDCADRLPLIERLFVEYHSFEGKEQRLDELLQTLRQAGLRVHLDSSEHQSRQPFLQRRTFNHKDMHVNIYADR